MDNLNLLEALPDDLFGELCQRLDYTSLGKLAASSYDLYYTVSPYTDYIPPNYKNYHLWGINDTIYNKHYDLFELIVSENELNIFELYPDLVDYLEDDYINKYIIQELAKHYHNLYNFMIIIINEYELLIPYFIKYYRDDIIKLDISLFKFGCEYNILEYLINDNLCKIPKNPLTIAYRYNAKLETILYIVRQFKTKTQKYKILAWIEQTKMNFNKFIYRYYDEIEYLSAELDIIIKLLDEYNYDDNIDKINIIIKNNYFTRLRYGY